MSVSKLKIARIEKDLTQDQLGLLAGITRQTVSLIEQNKYNPSLKLCISLCKILDKTLNDLFWEV